MIKARLAQTVAGRGTVLTVYWETALGGALNPSTGALTGSAVTLFSGTLTALAVETVPSYALRQFQEIQTGDLIVDCQPDPQVTLCAGQSISGTLPLSSLADSGVEFEFNGRLYAQAKITDKLADIWALTVQGVPVLGGLLLRRQT